MNYNPVLCCQPVSKIPWSNVCDAIIQFYMKNIERTWNEVERNLKMYNPGLDRRGATHFFTLRDPFMGRDPDIGNHCSMIWIYLCQRRDLKCKEVFNEETNFCFQTNKKYFKPTYMTYEVSKQTFFGLKVLLLLRKTKAYVKRKFKNKRQIKSN